MTTIDVKTTKVQQYINITRDVRNAVSESGIKNGEVLIFCPHTTAAITINESADPDVVHDIINHLEKIIPTKGNYNHMEGNSHAHIKSSLVGCSERVIIQNGELVLGTWQGIFFCEFDGPRSRRVHIKVSGDR